MRLKEKKKKTLIEGKILNDINFETIWKTLTVWLNRWYWPLDEISISDILLSLLLAGIYENCVGKKMF